MTTTSSAEWAIEHRVLARCQLLTAARELAMAVHEVDRMVGYLDGLDVANPGVPAKPKARYIELGMNEAHSRLLHVVRALDMGPELTPPGTMLAKMGRKP